MSHVATHRAPGLPLTPLGKLPSSRSLLGGAMLAGMLASGAATATAATAAPTPAQPIATHTAPSWPSCDGDGIPNNCPTPGATTAAAAPSWPSCDGDGIPNNCPTLGATTTVSAPTPAPSWPSCDGDGIPNNCPTPGGASSSSTASAPAAGSTSVASGNQIVSYAKQATGTTYKWGGATLSGMDCSGLVTWAYNNAGISLNGNRTADQIMRGGERISVSETQVGDLVGYKTGGSKYTHIAIYLGNGQLIDASGSRGEVLERSMWSSPDWHAVTYR